jgi:hypothetical protein
LYQGELNYPPGIGIEELVRLYRCGGVLTLLDMEVYIGLLRNARRVSKTSVIGTERPSFHLPQPGETLEGEHMKLDTLLLLDEQFGQQGTLLVLAWEAMRFNEGMLFKHQKAGDGSEHPFAPWIKSSAPWTKRERSLASLFILNCRWLQRLTPHDPSWVTALRERWRN